LEYELKFRVDAEFQLPPLEDVLTPQLRADAPRRVELLATYYDTADLRLARAGVTLRQRFGGDDEGWHLKLPALDEAPEAREELHAPNDPESDLPPERLRDLVTVFVRRAALEPVATMTTDRAVTVVRDEAGQACAEIVDDSVVAHDKEHVTARFREIEIEDTGGGRELVHRLGERLQAAGAVAGPFEPKLVRALGRQATEPSDIPVPTTMGRRPSTAVFLTFLLREQIGNLFSRDPWARLDRPDAVHQLRVAARRLRSSLRTFGPLLDPASMDPIAEELRWFGRQLAEARDAEVMQALLLPMAKDMSNAEGAADRLAGLLEGRRQAGLQQARTALSSSRYLDLVESLVRTAVSPPVTGQDGSATTRVIPLLHRAWRRMRKRVGKLTDDPATYHRARIAAKRFRYATEATVPIAGRRARRLAGKVKAVHDLLGVHQDAVVGAGVVAELASRPDGRDAGFALGALHERLLTEASERRTEFPGIYGEAARRKYRRWLRR
jgi:CHAD domain-containing protein